MEFKLIIVSVACFACLVPSAFGIGVLTDKAVAAVNAGTAIIGAGVQAKGTLLKALIGAKAGLIESLLAHKPSTAQPTKPCPASQSIPNKVSGLLSIIKKAAQFKANVAGKVLNSIKTPTLKRTTAKSPSIVYEIVRRPNIYPATLIARFD